MSLTPFQDGFNAGLEHARKAAGDMHHIISPDLLSRYFAVANAALELHDWLSTVSRTPHVRIEADDIGADGTTERLQALRHALLALSALPGVTQ